MLVNKILRRHLSFRRLADSLQVFRRRKPLVFAVFVDELLTADSGQFAERGRGKPLFGDPGVKVHSRDGSHTGDRLSTGKSPKKLRNSGPLNGYLPGMTKSPRKPIYPNNLGHCMAELGLTDPDLAKLANTNKQQIHKLRHGARKLTVEWAKRLARHMPPYQWYDLADDGQIDRRRAELVAGYAAADDQGREMLGRLARSFLS